MNFSKHKEVSDIICYNRLASKTSRPNRRGTVTGTMSIDTIISEISSGLSRATSMSLSDCTITSLKRNELLVLEKLKNAQERGATDNWPWCSYAQAESKEFCTLERVLQVYVRAVVHIVVSENQRGVRNVVGFVGESCGDLPCLFLFFYYFVHGFSEVHIRRFTSSLLRPWAMSSVVDCVVEKCVMYSSASSWGRS